MSKSILTRKRVKKMKIDQKLRIKKPPEGGLKLTFLNFKKLSFGNGDLGYQNHLVKFDQPLYFQHYL
jgi:hypothetical protein